MDELSWFEKEILQKLMGHVFPHNPEMLSTWWHDSEAGGSGVDSSRLLPANPVATMTPSDPDPLAPAVTEQIEEAALPWLDYSTLRQPATAEDRRTRQDAAPRLWFSNDLQLLNAIMQRTISLPVGGKCSRWPFLPVLKETCGNDTFMALGMLTYWKNKDQSPLRLISEKRRQIRAFDNEEKQAMQELIGEDLKHNIIKRIAFEEAKYISPTFPVKKKTAPGKKQKWRMVIDLRRVNLEQATIHFRMDGPDTVQTTAIAGDFAASTDISKAFPHVTVHDSMRPFLCFEFDNVCYQYQAMPFGAKHSPRVFTLALGLAVRYIRSNWSVRVVAYIDDLLFLHQDPVYLELAVKQITAYLASLGWTPALDKCEGMPSHEIPYLGLRWNFSTRTLTMTPEMRQAVRSLIKMTMLKAQYGVPMSSKLLGSVIGSLNFLRAQFPRASLYLRSLHSALTEMVKRVGWSGCTTAPRGIISELQWWWRNVSWNTPYCFAPRLSQAMLTTDAAEPGWGADLAIGNLRFDTYGFFSTPSEFSSSNQRESAAVLRALTHFRDILQEGNIHAMTIRSDNATTVCNLQRQGAGVTLLGITRAIFSLLQELDIRLAVAHIPGKLNTLTDAFSRMEVTGDYALNPTSFWQAIQLLGVMPTIDMFAHNKNNKLARFVSLEGSLSSGAVAIDAFRLDWSKELPYLFPPIQLVPEVLQRLVELRIWAIMVVPKYPSHAWWTTFRSLQVVTLELGPCDEVLLPGPGKTGSHVTLKMPPGFLLMALMAPWSPPPMERK
jgi:hypothetical protein